MLLSHSAVALGNIISHLSLIKGDRPGWTNLGAPYKGRKTGDDFIWVMDDRRLMIGNRGSNVYYSAISPGNIIHHLSLINYAMLNMHQPGTPTCAQSRQTRRHCI
jgi:hypothetical protein